MAKDKLKNESSKGSLDHMAELSKAALTVGVGAALLYRTGGKNLLSRRGLTSKEFISEAGSYIKSRDIRSYTSISGSKELYGKIISDTDSILNVTRRNIDSSNISLRMDDTRSLGGLLTQYKNLQNSGGQKLLETMFDNKSIKVPLANKFISEYAKDDIHMQRNIQRFVSESFDHSKDTTKVLSIAKKHKLNSFNQDDIVKMSQEILEKQKSLYNERNDFIKKNIAGAGGIIDSILDKMIDTSSLEKTFGAVGKTSIKRNFLDNVLNDHAVTVGDILKNKDKFIGNKIHYKSKTNKKDIYQDLTRTLEEVSNKLKTDKEREAFNNIYFDKNVLRKTGTDFHSFKDFSESINRALSYSGKTIPGKILKTRDIHEMSMTPKVKAILSGSIDPQLAALSNKEKGAAFITQDSHIKILDKMYRIKDKAIEHAPKLDDLKLISGRYGVQPRIIKEIFGDTDYRETDNVIRNVLDLGLDGSPNLLDRFKSKIRKFANEDWSGNALNALFKDSDTNYRKILENDKSNFVDDEHANIVESVLNKARILNNFYSKNTYGLTRDMAKSFADNTGPEASRFFRALSMGDDELLDMITTAHYNSNKSFDSLLNQDLSSLLNKYVADPISTRKILNIKSDKTNFYKGKEASGFFDILREEIAKEGFIQHVYESANGGTRSYDSIIDLFEKSGVKGTDAIEAKRLANWAVFQDKTQSYSRFMIGKTDEDKIDIASSVLEMFTTPDPTIAKEADAKFKEEFKRNLHIMYKEKTSLLESDYDSFAKTTDIIKGNDYGDYITLKKKISAIDVIKDINNETKRVGYVKQFFAGRNNPEDITTATIAPYFMLSRLSEPLASIGLSFSNKSNQSVIDLSKNILLKRIAPVGLGIVYADYVNDMVGAITGTSITGAIGNTVANIDLMSRKINDAIGITGVINNIKQINPFVSYYTGNHYMNYEERKDWYENGYSEVRKSRWWNFGSINEWRGSEISYYQPNYLRRIHSDWKDKSLYDSVWQKWARSPFPTPTAPFSTALYLANPYWLEEKHEDDRPYPMSGTLFSEEAPWGPILNPTIGELIKPQRKMHRDRLNKKYVDVKGIIEVRNREHIIKAKNKDKKNLIQFKDGSISTARFTGYGSPTPSQSILRFDVSNGNTRYNSSQGYQMFTGGAEAGDYLKQYTDITNGSDGSKNEDKLGLGTGYTPSAPKRVSFKNRVEISAKKGNVISDMLHQAINSNLSLSGIEQLNRATFAKASIMAQRPMEEGIITSTSIYRPGASLFNDELSKSDLSDLRGIASGDDFIGETAYAAKYLSGIYGYGLQKMFPGKHRKKLQDAGGINSPTRGFWDSNIGGLGGGSMEIIRRFIPFQNRNVDEVNPLMNNMPDWMPDRFRVGDPFTKIQKGEMRLPGRGYESINKLHPDEYGEYGSFDRFKILADIAPNSVEYKIWRDIVTKSNDNPYIKDEMEQIKNRVQNQSKKYDFHYKKFLGRKLDKRMAVIDEVLDNNYFTVVGDKTKYKMAGITMSTDEETGATLKDFVIPGANVLLSTDKDKYKASNVDGSINAAVSVDGENINKKLLDMKLAEIRENDMSAAANMARFSDISIGIGKVMEAVAHAPIPYFQQKFFKMREPLDSYKQEMVYGTPFASWDRPIDSYLKPAIERSLMSGPEVAFGTAMLAANKMIQNLDIKSGYKKTSTAALMLTNRGAFIGGFMGMVFGGGGELAKKSAQFGAVAQIASYALTRSDNVIAAPLSYGGIGAYIGSKLIKEAGALKGGAVGATVGLLISAHKSSLIDRDGLAPTWIPKRTKEKWEIEEYFDRLNYIKYSGLYEKAARKSLIFEGTNIKKLVNLYEKDVKDRLKIRREIQEYKDIIGQFYADGDARASEIMTDLDNKLNSIKESELLLSTGKWATSAIAYKQAMDSTAYGLKEGASWAELIRATPKGDREHFIEFSKEQDPEKRKEILKYVSPYHKKVLQTAWGQKRDRQKSMASFFSGHKLPKPMWSGWRPNVDLQDVKIKSIANEGMMLSDFGYYDSSLRDEDVINAPNLSKDDYDTGIGLRTSIVSSLNGLGLFGANVNVQRTQRPGIQMIANVARIAEYNISETFRNMTLF